MKKKRLMHLKRFTFTFFTWLIYSSCLSAQYSSDVLKAAYIERMTRFIEWPLMEITKDTSVFTIGVYEDPDFAMVLNQLFKEKNIKGKKVAVMEFTAADQIKNCDLIYLSDKARSFINAFVSTANSSGVLVSSCSNGFGERGVHINFYVENEKLKFEINRKSVDSGKFKISSLLLKGTKII